MGKAFMDNLPLFIFILVLSYIFPDIQAQDVNAKFKCLLTDQQAVELRYNGSESYMIIGEAKDVSTMATRFTVCRSLSDGTPGASSDYILYVIECFQRANQIFSSVTSAKIVNGYSAQAEECRTSQRAVLPPMAKTTTPRVTTTVGIVPNTTTAAMTTTPGFNISSIVMMQVLDETGFAVKKVVTTQMIHLRIQALTTMDYKPPFVNRCWYVLSSEEEEYEEDGITKETEELNDENDNVMFVQYGCSLKEPVLLPASRTPMFVSNGPLDVQSEAFNLQTLYDLDFDTLTFKCEVDLCTKDQYCRSKCPADGKTYRVPPNETLYGIVQSTVSVEKRATTTTTLPTKPTTMNPYIIRQTEQPPLQSQVQKSGMEKSQPYLIIACVIVGCIIMFLLCYLSFRIISAKNGQPGIDNPQEVGKVSYPGSLPGHAGGNVPYAGSRMTGPTPPPGYSTGVQPRTRLTSTPGAFVNQNQSMTQPLLASPTRGRCSHQTELLVSPAHLSDAYYKNTGALPSRYQDSPIVGGEYYPVRERPIGQLIGRELYYLPDGQGHLEQSLGSPLQADKRAFGSVLAREAALRQGSGPRRELFTPSGDREDQRHKQSEVGNLISKSLSEYIDRHGVAALGSLGQN